MFPGRNTSHFLEYFAEIIRIVKAQHIRNFIHQILVGIDQFFGMFNLYMCNVIRKCHAGKLFKVVAQITGTDVQDIGNFRECQFFLIMFFDIGLCLINNLIGAVFLAFIQKPAQFSAENLEPLQDGGKAVEPF